jgi:hypothetical protein
MGNEQGVFGEGGYTLRRDGKSAQVIGRKGDALRPWCRRVRKCMKTNGLNQGQGKGNDAKLHGLRIQSVLGFNASRLSASEHAEWWDASIKWLSE